MDLFSYIDKLFNSSKSDWVDISDYTKKSNFFMLNRIMSIKYPMQANIFNYKNTSHIGQSESWRILSSRFSRTPSFVFTKVNKKNKDKKIKFKNSTIEKFLNLFDINIDEFHILYKINESKINKILNEIESEED